MEYSNDVLKKMSLEKKMYNPKFARWYYGMFKEYGGELISIEYDGRNKLMPTENSINKYLFNRGNRINDCLNLWQWDKYDINKILDLQKVNRCMNRAFCPNCKMLNTARFIHEFRAIMPELLEKYDFYMLTLTVPSTFDDGSGQSVRNLLDLLSKKFQEFNRKFSSSLLTPTGKPSSKALQNRYFVMSGGIRVLEITYNEKNGFHPHYHCIVLVPKDSIDEVLLEETEKGKYSHNRNSFKYWSEIELQIGKAWTMLWHDISFRYWDRYDFIPSETYLKFDDEFTDFKNLQIDFTPLDDDGIYEVFKYTFKNSEVQNYNVFKTLVQALDKKRFRQGFGVLYNFQCEEFEEGEAQPLELAVPEEPQQLLTTEISQLITEYKDYKKISRFNKGDIDDVVNSITD